jgi:hypothetical protein
LCKTTKMPSHTAFSTEPRPLNDVQLMLLRLFSRNLSEKQTADIQAFLLHYLHEQLQVQLEEDFKQENITQSDLDAKLNEDQRTKLP